ncbi:MAG: hypothetical protein ACHQIO_23020, partial [Nevskiales bacterium]
LLAFKPVWALAFFLVPFLSRRWRFCLAMVASGTTLALLTIPFVGLHSWFDWLTIGKEAAELYDKEKNWIFLSRDLLSLPRRWLLDFELALDDRLKATLWPEKKWTMPAWLPTLVIGWGFVLFALENTVRLAVLRRKQATTPDGPPATFLFLGAWMCCFHFMYYDILLTALPLFVLLAEPRRYLEPIFLAIVTVPRQHLGDELASYYAPRPPKEHPPTLPLLKAGYRNLWVLNRMVPNVLLLLLFIEHGLGKFPLGVTVAGWLYNTPVQAQSATVQYENQQFYVVYHRAPDLKEARLTTTLWHGGQPWDTYLFIFLWLWCGLLWLRTPTQPEAAPWPGNLESDVVLLPLGDKSEKTVELETHVRGGHEGLT